ncbi:geranylgeranyl reductase family protein [Hymenobacter ginkgonis]|uniref:geranylgeranyl reductase family protein n=1 Tax=Hymenobacter ginkgonis TaxID=2682976 RepID=UPI0018DCD4AD|nr:geranylgeranyl reductase family protein [Hymenobacter ginkgonis]
MLPPTPPLPTYDVALVGAGPAGTACALALRGSGLRVALLDKAAFPRDKICGDAIPGAALKALAALDPAYRVALAGLRPQSPARHSRLVAPSGRSLWLHWQKPSFNSPRLDFDAALLGLVRHHTDTVILENTSLLEVTAGPDGVHLRTTQGELRCRLVVGCDGANSVVRRQLLPGPAQPQPCVGVRAYFENVADAPDDTTEFYFSRDYLAGYCWVFPVGNGRYNVGLGLLTELISAHKIDLKVLLREWLATHPALAERFAQARQLGPTRGFGLPLGGGVGAALPVAGTGFLLCGDAAALIDPLQGHGIDTAVESGILAAAQARRCCAAGAFDAAFMQPYTDAVQQQIGAKLLLHHRLMRLFSARPWLVNAAVRVAAVPRLRRWLQGLLG